MKKIGIIGFPMDLGGNQRGVDMGPSAIRLSDFDQRLESLNVDVRDFGNVLVHTRAKIEDGSTKAHHNVEIMRAAVAAVEMTQEVIADNRIPVTLGGDHTVALGSVWGMAKEFGPGGVIWIDAHADLNTPETTLSGNVHGMVLAHALGLCAETSLLQLDGDWPARAVLPEHTVLIATRDLDPGEREYLRRPGAPKVFTIEDIDRRGISAIADEAMEIASGAAFLHVSLDLDALDPRDAPGVGTPVRGGLSYREAHTLMEILSAADISSLDVVEVNPALDQQNATATLAGELICSLFGARIL